MSTATSPPVLLVIDLQQGLVEAPPENPRSTPNLIPNVEKLLKHWRSKAWPILHVQHDDIYDESNDISASYPQTFKIHASAAPIANEPVFIKNVGSAFVGPGLPAALEKLGKRPIVVMGMDGRECVNNSTRHGADLGYEIIVVWDACATYGMENLKGEPVDAETAHEMAMAMLASYASVENTEKVLELFQK
ncbi:Isochorismatase hydrolase [Mollisia scopiformis]|uniref:Isochorismatase hydrolase n=1 Tax=Mollisia scopiformis TaxID=149040 RepID=A0A132B977_MOLSC|nr:Isochorismatase hydrolase [Mollisia scopiformis]KUJ08960.1 Isochorismatase hydrolase [Mollisia scopiformis]